MHNDLQRVRHGYYDLWFGTNAVYERWAKAHGLNNNMLLTLYLLKEYPDDCTQHLICEKPDAAQANGKQYFSWFGG